MPMGTHVATPFTRYNRVQLHVGLQLVVLCIRRLTSLQQVRYGNGSVAQLSTVRAGIEMEP